MDKIKQIEKILNEQNVYFKSDDKKIKNLYINNKKYITLENNPNSKKKLDKLTFDSVIRNNVIFNNLLEVIKKQEEKINVLEKITRTLIICHNSENNSENLKE